MLSKSEIIEYLNETDQSVVEDLYRWADRVRKEEVGNAIHVRGLIEFSNYCAQDCIYCGLRRHNKKAIRYRMPIHEILQTAQDAKNFDLKTVVMQSGEEAGYDIDELCQIVSGVKDLGVAITLSIGEYSLDDYKKLKDAGADRFLLRFETSDPVLYAKLRPGNDHRHRFQCLEWLREAGFQVGSGIMVGLPGQTAETLANDILLFRDLNLDMIGNGPFISNPDTPLAGEPNGTIDQILRFTALTRIVTRNTHLPATTATGSIDPIGRQKALQCGANVIMPNLTPTKYREHYLLYPGKICIEEEPRKCREDAERMILSLGRTMGSDAGHSRKSQLSEGRSKTLFSQ